VWLPEWVQSATMLAALSAVAQSAHSVISARALQAKKVSSRDLTLSSVVPAFMVALMVLPMLRETPTLKISGALVLKNLLYGVCLWYRFRGFGSFGKVGGILAAGTQPFLLAVLASVFLHETLSLRSWIFLFASSGVLILQILRQRPSFRHFWDFVMLPGFMMSVVSMIDRAVVKGGLSPEAFFVWDKIFLLPSAGLALGFAKRNEVTRVFRELQNFRDSWQVHLYCGLAWMISSFLYGQSLRMESLALVPAIRNLSFPLAALWTWGIFRKRQRLARAGNPIRIRERSKNMIAPAAVNE
jgi:drug/metabolite transporter (DMT)-like permease